MTDTRLSVLEVLPFALALMGVTITGMTIWDSMPEVPEDLLSFAGGWYAFQDGQDPYEWEDMVSSLDDRGLDGSMSYDFVYSPVFLFLMSPLRFLGAATFSKVWFLFMLLSGWTGVFLITSVARTPGDRCLMLFFMVLLMAFKGPMISALRWGQVTPLLLLAAGIAVSRGMRSTLTAAALGVILFTKVFLAPVLLALRGLRTWVAAAVTLVFFIVFSIAVFGLNTWEGYFDKLDYLSQWSLTTENNLSLSSASHQLCAKRLVTGDPPEEPEERAILDQRITRCQRIGWATVVLLSGLVLALQFAGIKDGFRAFWKEKYSSLIIFALLCWWVLLVSPVVWDHYGLFLLPLLPVAERYLGLKRAIPILLLIAAWFLLPMDTLGARTARPLICLAGIHYFAACLPGVPD